MSRTFRVAVAAAVLIAVAACDSTSGSEGTTSPTAAPSTTTAPNLSDHESGPESPIAYGLYVPAGATQLGPLFRYRSEALIAAYQPELQAIQAQKAADAAAKVAEDEANGTPSPTPTPTPTTRPSPDTFKAIGDEAPRPDTSISLMRIDGDPSDVVRRMLAQIDAAIPSANLVLDDLSTYCTSEERRITGCQVVATGPTTGKRDIRVSLSVDTGDLATRTAPPGALTRPVMELTVEYVGDPRTGQLGRDTGKLGDVADISKTPDRSGLIWPKMDLDADLTTPLVNGWLTPPSVTLLLSGYKPQFVAMTAEKAVDADQIAEQFAVTNSRKGAITKDVVEDLNSVSTTYTARGKGGSVARAVYILSARGNYTALFYTPAAK